MLAPSCPRCERSKPSGADGARQPLELGVFERHPDGVLRLRAVRGTEGDAPDFLCTCANPAAVSLLGGSALHGEALSRLQPAFAQGATRAALAETLRTGEPYRGELPLSPSGSFVLVTALKDEDGLLLFAQRRVQTGGSAGLDAETLERQQLANRLRESEERSSRPSARRIRRLPGART